MVWQQRNYMAVWNVLRIDPAFWKHAFWDNLRLARQAQAHGAMQKVRELAPLIALLRRRRPKVVVEIGTARGGTFYAWCKVAESDAVIVSIDLPGGRFGGGYTGEDIAVLRRYGQAPQQLHFVQGDSHDEQTKATLLEILNAKRIDFLMIDGDHSYEGVKRDFEMYSPLVTPGCPVAFHDILPHAADQGCEVDLFWTEVKDDYLHTEFIDPYCDSSGRRYGGIGVLYWATQPRSGTLRRMRGNR
jgi:predicted O-methyltransferase YrrM